MSDLLRLIPVFLINKTDDMDTKCLIILRRTELAKVYQARHFDQHLPLRSDNSLTVLDARFTYRV